MDFRILLYSSVYSNQCSFSNISDFVRYVERAIKDKRPHLLKDMGDPTSNFSEIANIINPGHVEHSCNETALATLISNELTLLGRSITSLNLTNIDINEEILQEDLAHHVHHLQTLGVKLSTPYFTVVKVFPPPFDQFKWSAFCPDKEDERRYGIRRGIYFREESLRPQYSRILLAHELVHTIPGEKNPELLAMGLEEGLAEIVGSLYLATRIIDKDIVRNVFIYGRHGSQVSTLWRLYLDHGRQAALLYLNFGINGLIELLISGRRKIHNVEMRIIEGAVNNLDLPKGEFPDILSQLVNQLYFGYLPNYVLQPLEAYLIRFVEEGKSVVELSEESAVPLDLTKKILTKISENTVLFILDGDIIAYSNVHYYRSLAENGGVPILRYEVV